LASRSAPKIDAGDLARYADLARKVEALEAEKVRPLWL
jgi:hypothetical protein